MSKLQGFVQISALGLLIIVVFFLFRFVINGIEPAVANSTSDPNFTETSVSEGYPGPGTPTSPSITAIPTINLKTPLPPPNWPTNEPWPPNTYTPPPPPTPIVYPTPIFLETPTGERPATLNRLWFPFQPNSSAPVNLRAILVDQGGQSWGDAEDNQIPLASHQSDFIDLIPSPNGQWIAINAYFRPSILVDKVKGATRPILDKLPTSLHFLTWASNNQKMIALLGDVYPPEVWEIDINSQEYQPIPFNFLPDDRVSIREAIYTQ